jgi:large subunit ribosomal protein L4
VSEVKVEIKDSDGKQVGDVQLSDELFGVTPNRNALHQVVRLQMAMGRSGTASTRTRSEVRGGGAKPWRQKGTGRARAGSIRSPLWKGGGAVFGPKPRDYSFKVPRKVRRLAFTSALSASASEGRLSVMEDFALDTPSTKVAARVLGRLGLEGTVILVVNPEDVNVEKSFRNIPGLEVFYPFELNTYDILRFDNILFFKRALEKLQGGGASEESA